MGHCDVDSMQDSDTKMTKEKDIETKTKTKMKNNTYDKIKHIVKSQGEKMTSNKIVAKSKPEKKKISIDL